MTSVGTYQHRTRPGERLRVIVRSHPLRSYFVAAFAFAWAVEFVVFGLFDVPEVPGIIVAALGPPIAAIVVTHVTDGRAGVRALTLRLLQWRVGLRWYAFSLVLVPAVGVPSFVFLSDGTENLPAAAAFVPSYLLFVLIMMTMGGGQEELGWRGYALGPLQERFGAFRASVVLGVIWGFWHLPLYVLVSGYNNAGSGAASIAATFAGFVGYTVALSLLFTWAFNSTGRSVFFVMLLHGSVNAVFGFAPERATAAWCLTGAIGALAVAITAITRGRLGRTAPSSGTAAGAGETTSSPLAA